MKRKREYLCDFHPSISEIEEPEIQIITANSSHLGPNQNKLDVVKRNHLKKLQYFQRRCFLALHNNCITQWERNISKTSKKVKNSSIILNSLNNFLSHCDIEDECNQTEEKHFNQGKVFAEVKSKQMPHHLFLIVCDSHLTNVFPLLKLEPSLLNAFHEIFVCRKCYDFYRNSLKTSSMSNISQSSIFYEMTNCPQKQQTTHGIQMMEKSLLSNHPNQKLFDVAFNHREWWDLIDSISKDNVKIQYNHGIPSLFCTEQNEKLRLLICVFWNHYSRRSYHDAAQICCIILYELYQFYVHKKKQDSLSIFPLYLIAPFLSINCKKLSDLLLKINGNSDIHVNLLKIYETLMGKKTIFTKDKQQIFPFAKDLGLFTLDNTIFIEELLLLLNSSSNEKHLVLANEIGNTAKTSTFYMAYISMIIETMLNDDKEISEMSISDGEFLINQNYENMSSQSEIYSIKSFLSSNAKVYLQNACHKFPQTFIFKYYLGRLYGREGQYHKQYQLIWDFCTYHCSSNPYSLRCMIELIFEKGPVEDDKEVIYKLCSKLLKVDPINYFALCTLQRIGKQNHDEWWLQIMNAITTEPNELKIWKLFLNEFFKLDEPKRIETIRIVQHWIEDNFHVFDDILSCHIIHLQFISSMHTRPGPTIIQHSYEHSEWNLLHLELVVARTLFALATIPAGKLSEWWDTPPTISHTEFLGRDCRQIIINVLRISSDLEDAVSSEMKRFISYPTKSKYQYIIPTNVMFKTKCYNLESC